MTGKKTAGRATVASLAADLEALRGRVAVLEAALAATGATTSAAVAAAPETAPAPTPAPKTDHDPQGSAQRLLRDILAIALEPEPDDADALELQFVRFLDYVHSTRKGTPILENSLRQYTWRQLRRNAPIYLRDPEDAGSFDVTRQDPATIDRRTDTVKFFLRATSRMPTPITFRRDDADGGAWRIEASSL